MAANRGKYAERKVSELFKELAAANYTFDFIRLPDARTGRGSGKQVGDFQVFLPGSHIVVEVKELGSESRMPKHNLTQLPKMRRREMAGGKTAVFIYHTSIKKWRVVTFDWLYERVSLPSWDLSEIPVHESAAAAWAHYVNKLF